MTIVNGKGRGRWIAGVVLESDAETVKLQHWRSFSGLFAWKAAPVLEFHFMMRGSRFAALACGAPAGSHLLAVLAETAPPSGAPVLEFADSTKP